jgi:hypothetical protein
MVKGTRLVTAHLQGFDQATWVDTEITTVVIQGVTNTEHPGRCLRTARVDMFADCDGRN